MTEQPQNKLENASFKLPKELNDWLANQAENQGRNKTKVLIDILQERMVSRPSGFKHDMEWLLEENYSQKGTNDLVYNHHEQKGENNAFDTAYKLVNRHFERKGEEIVCYVIPAESTRENLKDLFANAVIFNVENDHPVILLIPYILTPDHRIWKAFEKYPDIHICTPDRLLIAIKDIQLAWDQEIARDTIDWNTLFRKTDYDDLEYFWIKAGDDLSRDEYEMFRESVQERGADISLNNETLEQMIKYAGFRSQIAPFI